MVQIPSALAAIKADEVTLFYCIDPNLGNLPLLVFHGPSTSINATNSTSRIQIHIIHPAGAVSYPRLTVSPNSPIYEVVDYLSKEWQGDEVCRGLAYAINKYFGELSDGIKKALVARNADVNSKRRSGTPQRGTPTRGTPTRTTPQRIPPQRERSESLTPSVELFSKQHAANLASSLVKVENVAEVVRDILAGFKPQFMTNLDIDLVLPPGTIRALSEGRNPDGDDENFDEDRHQYGLYAGLVKLFGEGCFLPTTKMKRAPSRALNRSRSFLKDQKLSLRREMAELVDTEERYVVKLHDLVNNLAEKFRTRARERNSGSLSPSEADVMKLFPKSLDQILKVNKGFLNDIQKVMDDTEDAAMEDLEKDEPTFGRNRFGGTGRLRDPTGAGAFAKVMLEWFPRFSDCYQHYIRASQHFPTLLSTFMRNQSSFSQRVRQTGEQKLKSIIIEPVQRLPRYSLFIDNIVNYLPATHPAQGAMLKARDIITSICSLDPIETDNAQVVKRLRSIVYNWPTAFLPQGRLISAADFVEMAAPYHLNANASGATNGILLLFADSVVVCKCSRDSTITARGVIAEVDKPSTAAMMAQVTNASNSTTAGGLAPKGLIFIERYPLSSIRFTESDDNRAVWLTNSLSLEKDPSHPCRRAFLLRGAHEGKAFKWTEEVTKARIEGRFSEKERESDTWELRHITIKDAGLSVYTAVFEEGIDTLIDGRRDPAPIRIVVDHEKGTKGAPVGHYGVEIVGNLSVSESLGHISYHVSFDGLNGRRYSDFADDSTIIPVFCRRVSSLIQNHVSIRNAALTPSFIAYHINILTALKIKVYSEQPKPEPARSASPIKFLGNFLGMGGATSTPVGDAETKKLRRTPVFGSIPNLSASSLTRSNSKKEKDMEPAPKREVESAVTSTATSFGIDEAIATNPLMRLEETFNAYITSIQSRKGNVVGRIIHNRAAADELAVNAIYNTFMENPHDKRAPAEATVDVLFRAFEKFLHMAWHLQMGPVVSVLTLQRIQEKSSHMRSSDYASFIMQVLSDMAPQNRRAFVAIIKLLSDLLEGCGNDADRGILTAAFSELIVLEDPHRYINLLDKLVDESDNLFENLAASNSNQNTPYGSVNSTMRSNMSAQAGSVTSQTSSFRRRFGFDTLLRTNSKKDDDKSSWRLSKSKGMASNHGSPESYSKGSLHRTKSTDTSAPSSPERPKSGIRPTILGAFGDHRPQSAQHLSPTHAASPPPQRPTTTESQRVLKKKRRSSLSDLRTLMAEAAIKESPEEPPARTNSAQPDLPVTSPLAERRHKHNPSPKPQPMIYGSPRTPSPIKPSLQRESRYNSPNLKENTPMAGGSGSLRGVPTPQTAVKVDDSARIQDLWTTSDERKTSPHKPSASLTAIAQKEQAPMPPPHKPTSSLPHIPYLPGAPRPLQPAPSFGTPAFNDIAGRTKAGSNSLTVPSGQASLPAARANPQKLRLQSPSKIRERLKHEKLAAGDAEASLQTELSKIGQEMARLSGGRTSGSDSLTRSSSKVGSSSDIRHLRERLGALESQIPIMISNWTAKNEAIALEVEKSLVAAEYRVTNMDKLYKEAQAENIELYERFNNELVKIVRVLRSKNKLEEAYWVDGLRESNAETAKLHKEVLKLRRENVNLKSIVMVQDMKIERDEVEAEYGYQK